MADPENPGCLARVGQWLFLIVAGLLIGAILAGAIHAWNPTFGILVPTAGPGAQAASLIPILPTMSAQIAVGADTQAAAAPSTGTSTITATDTSPVTQTTTPMVTTTGAPTEAAPQARNPVVRTPEDVSTTRTTVTTTVTTTPPLSGTLAAPDEDTRFLAQAQALFVTYVTQLETLSQRMMAALDDPTLVNEPGWLDATNRQVADIRAVGSEVRALIAPLRYAAAWDDMRIATVFFDRALDALLEAVETRSSDQVQAARTNLQLAVEAVNRAATALQAALPTVPTDTP